MCFCVRWECFDAIAARKKSHAKAQQTKPKTGVKNKNPVSSSHSGERIYRVSQCKYKLLIFTFVNMI